MYLVSKISAVNDAIYVWQNRMRRSEVRVYIIYVVKNMKQETKRLPPLFFFFNCPVPGRINGTLKLRAWGAG